MIAPPPKRVALEAASWVVKFDDVAFNARDVARFRRWLAKSDAHRTAFETASRTWNRLDLLAKLDAFELPDVRSKKTQIDRRQIVAGGVSALAVGAISVAAVSVDHAAAHETGVGETRELALPDGTRVILNADSKIEARIDDTMRRVSLIRGEALFSLADNTAPIFCIVTPRGDIEAASGDILVKILASGTRVTLLSSGARAQQRRWLGQSAPLLAPANSEIILTHQGVEVIAARADQLADRTSWRQGMLAFDGTPLGEAADDLARQTGVNFVFSDDALPRQLVTGRIRKDDLAAFLALLESNLAIASTRRGNEITLRASGG